MTITFTTYLDFLWAGLLKHGQTGGLVPSQKFLIVKMIAPVPEAYRGHIVELGAGSGALTVRLQLDVLKHESLRARSIPVWREKSGTI
ncbi:MAG: hypothetical protein HZA90_19875 [Verrucomicrobia bacterium]|nr:hypothetical protein [Verrucomicrobiota bacterium]